MEAQGRAFGLEAGGAADARGRGRLDQAFETAPAGADAEQIESVDQGIDRRFRRRLQHHPEEAAGTEKIAFPQGVAGILGQRRIEHARNLGPGLQPAGDRQRVSLVAFEPHAQGAQSAQGEVDVVRPGAMTDIGGHRAHLFVHLLGGDDGAEHHVGMADDVFGGGVDRHVDAVLKRRKQPRRGPGVVHQHRGAAVVRYRRNRRHVLHLEGQRARRFDIDDFGVGPHQPGDALADQRVVIGRLDTAAGQHIVAEIARRPVHRIDHQHVVAGLQARLQRGGDRRQPGGHQHRAIAAFDRRHRFFEGKGRRRAEQAVADHVEPLAGRALGLPLGHVGRQDRRSVVDGRVDRTMMRLGMAPEMGQQGVLAVVPRPVVVFHKALLRRRKVA